MSDSEYIKDAKGLREPVKHYSYSKYEPIDVINEWDLSFNAGNVIKYIARYRYKGTPIEDLKKARTYIDFEIDKLENNQKK